MGQPNKLDADAARRIRRLLAAGKANGRQLAAQYGVTEQAISAVKRGLVYREDAA
jgi:DNA-binding Xre family transcriptional regulator